jgi:hypothetical protein
LTFQIIDYLDENPEILQVASVPPLEWVEKLKTIRLGINVDLKAE